MENSTKNNLFNPAKITGSKLRLALTGVSGSGKTYSSLRIATGLGGKIGVICTEHGRAKKYAEEFEYDVAEMTRPYSIDKYLHAITTAVEAEYDVLIIDSLTHAWKFLLEEVETAAVREFKGNEFRAWGKYTPVQNNFLDEILSFPGHLITTIRSKTEYAVEFNSNGKAVPRRIGMKPDQRGDLEYEFDMLIELDSNHVGKVIKDMTHMYQDSFIERPSEELGKTLNKWVTGEYFEDNEQVEEEAQLTLEEQKKENKRLYEQTEKVLPILLKDYVKDMEPEDRFEFYFKHNFSVECMEQYLKKLTDDIPF